MNKFMAKLIEVIDNNLVARVVVEVAKLILALAFLSGTIIAGYKIDIILRHWLN